MISYDDFKKVEIRAGKIISAEKIPNTDKLLKLIVDFGEIEEIKTVKEKVDVAGIEKKDEILSEENVKETNKEVVSEKETNSELAPNESNEAVKKISKPRQIVSGIALYFPDPAVLVGKICMFVTNLEPRTIKGYESNGMIFAVSTPEGGFSLLEPNSTISPGTLAA